MQGSGPADGGEGVRALLRGAGEGGTTAVGGPGLGPGRGRSAG